MKTGQEYDGCALLLTQFRFYHIVTSTCRSSAFPTPSVVDKELTPHTPQKRAIELQCDMDF